MVTKFAKRKKLAYCLSFLTIVLIVTWAGFMEYCRVNSPIVPVPEAGKIYAKNYHGKIVYLSNTEHILMYALPGSVFLIGIITVIITPKKKSFFDKDA